MKNTIYLAQSTGKNTVHVSIPPDAPIGVFLAVVLATLLTYTHLLHTRLSIASKTAPLIKHCMHTDTVCPDSNLMTKFC